MRRVARLTAVVTAVTAGMMALLLPAQAATTFSNTAPINLPGPGPGVPGPTRSSLYPSNIVVSGLSGTVTDVNLTLNGFDCSSRGADFAYPEDVDILLVGPTGVNLVVLSDVGGANQDDPIQFTNITVTLDDEAATPLPADTQLTSGTFRPLDDDDDPMEQPGLSMDVFPTPAPTPSAATALSVFDGTQPNGTWSLYVVDDFPGPNNCSILRGWALEISTTADTSSTTAPSTSTTAPSTSTTAPSTTTTAPSTSTTAPSTSTTAPSTSTTAPSTTTTRPTTTSTTIPSSPCVAQFQAIRAQVDQQILAFRAQILEQVPADQQGAVLALVEAIRSQAIAQINAALLGCQ